MTPIIDHIQITVKKPGDCRTIHRRKPGALHHLAFKATSQMEVDELYQKIKETGAHIVDPPKFYPQHGEKYYALFFKDPDGIKYEIVYEERNS